MNRTATERATLLLRAGVIACTLAVVALAVPGIGYLKAHADPGVQLDGAAQVTLPAHRTFGVYVDDADNSGYSFDCGAQDADGREIAFKDPSWSVSSSETEDLDAVFDTGSGDLRISCAVGNEQVRIRPLPNDLAMLLGFLVAGPLGIGGLCLLARWLTVRTVQPALVDA